MDDQLIQTEQLPHVDMAGVSPEVQKMLNGEPDGGSSREDVDDFLSMVGEFTFGGDVEQIESYKKMARPLLLWLGFDGVLIPITTMSPRVRLFGTLGVLVLAAVVVKVRDAREKKQMESKEGDQSEQRNQPKQQPTDTKSSS